MRGQIMSLLLLLSYQSEMRRAPDQMLDTGADTGVKVNWIWEEESSGRIGFIKQDEQKGIDKQAWKVCKSGFWNFNKSWRK